jgi:hypothetical protein
LRASSSGRRSVDEHSLGVFDRFSAGLGPGNARGLRARGERTDGLACNGSLRASGLGRGHDGCGVRSTPGGFGWCVSGRCWYRGRGGGGPGRNGRGGAGRYVRWLGGTWRGGSWCGAWRFVGQGPADVGSEWSSYDGGERDGGQRGAPEWRRFGKICRSLRGSCRRVDSQGSDDGHALRTGRAGGRGPRRGGKGDERPRHDQWSALPAGRQHRRRRDCACPHGDRQSERGRLK